MVNDLRDLMQRAVDAPPEDGNDLGAVLRAGRGRVHRRRRAVAAGVAATVAVAGGAGVWAASGGEDGDRVANRTVPAPDGPVLHLAQAEAAVEGKDYDVLASHTNKDLDADNGQYYDGVTDDGRILFRDGPRAGLAVARFALVDPATGAEDRLPLHDVGSSTRAVELSADRVVLVSPADDGAGLRAHVFDRRTRTWSAPTWPALPAGGDPFTAAVGPDGRLYVAVGARDAGDGVAVDGPADGPADGPEVDDAGAAGDTRRLWSVGLDDPADVRDEGLRVGSFAFTDDTLVFSAATNGVNDEIHVRDLATGTDRVLDPRSGARCNLLDLGATDDLIVLSQYCGTYDDGRDDRIQVIDTDGDPVTTLQGDNLGGGVAGGLVQVTSYDGSAAGTYVWEPDGGRLVRVTDGVSSWSLGGPTPAGYLLWDTPYGSAAGPREPVAGATQWLARWRS